MKQEQGDLLLLLLSAGKLGKVLLSGGAMLISIVAYAFIYGWWYAVGFVRPVLISPRVWRLGLPILMGMFFTQFLRWLNAFDGSPLLRGLPRHETGPAFFNVTILNLQDW